MLIVSSTLYSLLSKGYFINDRELSERPITNNVTYIKKF